MNSQIELKLAWCSAQAAKHAVERWHYSRKMPRFKLVKIGVWENNVFIGVVIFGQGATPQIASPFGLHRTQVCELVRVAMNHHRTPTTRIIAIAIRMVRSFCKKLKLVVSFADSAQGHHGGIYCGGNWIYLGAITHHAYRINGKIEHPKTLHSRYGKGGQSIPWLKKHVDINAERLKTAVKHKYVMPLDKQIAKELLLKSRPYPKRVKSETSDTPGDQSGEGGATPTLTLQYNMLSNQ